MAILFDSGIFSVIGLASELLVGAKLYWYASGTSTPLATYSDRALTIPNANPVPADATGRFPAIWLQAADYKMVLKSALDVTLVTRDPIIGSTAVDTLAGAAGSGLIGFSHAPIYPAGTQGRKDQQTVDPRDAPYNAVGDGVTDDAIALQAALATGRKVQLQPGVTYAFGQRLDVPANGGFVGGGNLLMLTGAGKFDAAAYGGGYAANKVGIYGTGVENPTVEATVVMQANPGIRVCNAVSLGNCTGVRVKVEASGFKEAEFPIIDINSCPLPDLGANVHDCGTDSTSLGAMQITGLGIDYNRIGGVNTTGATINATFKNIILGNAAAALYGQQTDGCNIQTTGYSGARVNIYAENIGEAFDNFGDGVTGTVNGKDVVYYGCKLIHGASDCNLRGSINGTGGAAVVIGSDNNTKSCENNVLDFAVSRIGVLTPPVALVKAAFQTDGTSGVFQPKNNRIRITANGDGGAMTHIVSLESGANNTIDADGFGFTTQFGSMITGLSGTATTANGSPNLTAISGLMLVPGQSISGAGIPVGTTIVSATTTTAVMSANATASATVAITAPMFGNIIRRKQNTHISAYIGTATTVTPNAVIAFDTEQSDPTAEYNPATGTATVRCAGRYRCRAQIRSASFPSLKTYGVTVQVSGSEIRRFQTTQMAAVAADITAAVDAIVECAAGDTIRFVFVSDQAGASAVTNNSASSFMQIEQI